MKYVVSRYNHDYAWLDKYTDDVVMYDRSANPAPGSIPVPNLGTDIYDKFTFIIDNYDSLPEVAVYTKCNLFKYITEPEFQEVKDATTFTPLLTRSHITHLPISFYSADGLYNEINNMWYLNEHPPKDRNSAERLMFTLGLTEKKYLAFAPGSNYIIPRENILKHSKDVYKHLRSYLEWDRYPGEAQIMERGLWYLWS